MRGALFSSEPPPSRAAHSARAAPPLPDRRFFIETLIHLSKKADNKNRYFSKETEVYAIVNLTNFPNFYSLPQRQMRQAAPLDPLVSMLNRQAGSPSPLEAAQQALLDAKARLDEHRNEQIEQALDGYRALRSRQTSYEGELQVHQDQLDTFQSLCSRRDRLTGELSAARADYAAYAAPETTPDMTQCNKLSLRVSSLERELASVSQDLSGLVDQANRYSRSQRQYAAYLESTDQGGYAAYEYQEPLTYTQENFASETSGMIRRMEAGGRQWRERVSSYCGTYGLTPYDVECYLQERRKLADAYLAAQQRVSELLYTTENAALEDQAGQAESAQDGAALFSSRA